MLSSSALGALTGAVTPCDVRARRNRGTSSVALGRHAYQRFGRLEEPRAAMGKSAERVAGGGLYGDATLGARTWRRGAMSRDE